MKIYIENYDIQQLTLHIDEFEKYMINKKNIIMVYTEYGLFEIDENNIYKQHILRDSTKTLFHEKKWNLIIDESEIQKTKVYSLPLESHFVKAQTTQYKIIKSKECDMLLVIISDENNKPVDFYIETTNINHYFAEHINVFLSMLN